MHMKPTLIAVCSGAVLLAGCASSPSPAELDAKAQQVMQGARSATRASPRSTA